MNKHRICLFPILLFITSMSGAYDQVKLEKTVPLVEKNADPGQLRLDNDGNIWMLNHALGTLQKISMEGRAEQTLSPGKKKDTLFAQLSDFTFTKNGSLLLSDPKLNQIVLVAPNLTAVVKTIPVNAPAAVAMSGDDIIAVFTSKDNLIKIFSLDGVALHDLFPPEKQPFKTITALAYSKDGVLWALDGDAGKLHRFSPQRKWLGATEGLDGGTALAVDNFGFAYVTVERGQWKEINPAGKLTGTFGAKGKEAGKMAEPVGVAILGDKVLWIAEKKNKRLQSFNVSNQDKKTALLPEPAARLQIRRLMTTAVEAKAVVINSEKEILVLNFKKSKFDWLKSDGSVKSSWNNKKELKEPVAMAFDPKGALWIADQNQHQVKKVSDTGEIELTIGQKGKKEGSLKNPEFLQIRPDGSFVIVDKDRSRVQVLSPDGLFQFHVGDNGSAKGQFKSVGGLAVSADRIGIIDPERKALLFYDANGKFISETANVEGKAPIWNQLTGIAADDAGRFFVLDKGSGRVRLFSVDGKYIADFFATGDGMTCGPDHTLVLFGEKSLSMYGVYPNPLPVEKFVAEDDAGDIKLSWDTTADSAFYNIYKSSNASAYYLLSTATVGSLIDHITTPGVSYRYAIRGVNGLNYEGNWAQSATIKASRRKDVSLVSIVGTDFKPIFTAAFKYYVNEPIGQIQIENNNDVAYRNVKLSLLLKKYSDFPTEKVISQIDPGQKLFVPVNLTFNNLVLELTEDTPVQLEIKVTYFEDNVEKSVSQNAPLKLYSRNAISWNETARIASFITPKDGPIVEFSRQAIRAFLAPLKSTTLPKPLAKAALFFEALRALNISYVQDPKTPFAQAVKNPDILDYTQFPRETLRRKTGDCDDTTALMSALLESIGVEAAVVDTPGHIFMMANLEESDPAIIGLPLERFVEFRGTYWVPIETTKLNTDFIQSWTSAMSTINQDKDKGTVKFVSVDEAHAKYAPVTLIEEDSNQPAFPEQKVSETFPKILEQLEKERFDLKIKIIQDQIAADPKNQMLRVQLGMAYVEGKNPDRAADIFTSVLMDESVDVKSAANNNLGNLAFLKGDYAAAEKAYGDAATLVPQDGGIMINRARVAWKMNDKDAAQKFIKDAQPLIPHWKEFVSDLPADFLPK